MLVKILAFLSLKKNFENQFAIWWANKVYIHADYWEGEDEVIIR